MDNQLKGKVFYYANDDGEEAALKQMLTLNVRGLVIFSLLFHSIVSALE